MKVLADCHHEEAYESHRILFEDRLGWELYRQKGIEWYEKGFWAVNNNINTAKGYLLSLHNGRQERDYKNIQNKEITYKSITFEEFKDTKFDIILSSLPWDYEIFEVLRKEHQPQAKHIFRMANNWAVPTNVKNLLNATIVPNPIGMNAVNYHSEFDLNFYNFTECNNTRVIKNFKHYIQFPYTEVFYCYEKYLEDFKFLAHGAGNRDLAMPLPSVPQALKSAGFLWHIKPEDDGYGFILHQAMACGRPVITCMSHYVNRNAGKLLEDKVTCINLDGRTMADSLNLIRFFSQPENYPDISKRCYERFKQVVDFDKEFEEIKKFLERLI